jgi:hypothetical protein
VPVNVIPGGFHCSDLSIANGVANAGAAAVQKAEVAQIKAFVQQWPKKAPGYGYGGYKGGN